MAFFSFASSLASFRRRGRRGRHRRFRRQRQRQRQHRGQRRLHRSTMGISSGVHGVFRRGYGSGLVLRTDHTDEGKWVNIWVRLVDVWTGFTGDLHMLRVCSLGAFY